MGRKKIKVNGKEFDIQTSALGALGSVISTILTIVLAFGAGVVIGVSLLAVWQAGYRRGIKAANPVAKKKAAKS